MHRRRALRLCLLLFACCARARGAGRCPDVSLEAPNAKTTVYAGSCLDFLRDNGLEHLYMPPGLPHTLCRDVAHGDGAPTHATCACQRGTREPHPSYARRTHDANWTGVHVRVPSGIARQLSCTTECPPQLAAVLESTDTRSCACWHRVGCALSERLADVPAATRKAVLLVPSDLAFAPQVVACDYAYSSKAVRAAAHLLCGRYGIDVQLAAACDYDECREPGARCARASGPIQCKLQCDENFYHRPAAADGLGGLGHCRPCTVCNATQSRTSLCHATFDTACVAYEGEEQAQPVMAPPCAPGTRYDFAHGRCVRCESGRSWTATNNCSLCAANHDSGRRALADYCEPCEPGTARPDALADTGCEPCPAGTARAANESDCLPCPPGLASAPGFDECVQCPAGHVPSSTGAECVACAANMPYTRDGTCAPCPVGTHTQAGSCAACVLAPALRCPLGTYRDDCTLKTTDGSCACGCRPCAEAPEEHARALGCRGTRQCAAWERFDAITRECVQYQWDTLPDARLFVFDPAEQTEVVPLRCLDWVARYADAAAFHLVQPLDASVDNRTLSELVFADALPWEVRALPHGLCHFACAEGYAFATVRGPRTRAWCVLVESGGTAGDGQCAMQVEAGDFVRVQRLVAGASIV
mgnify:CR=1 FL=1